MIRLVFFILSFGLFGLSITANAQPKMLTGVELSNVSPKGWIRLMMDNQVANFTSKLDIIGFPFTQGGWGREPFLRNRNGVMSGFWVPYEQTAYFYDGMLRCGLILDEPGLLAKARSVIYKTIHDASKVGVMNPVLAEGEMRRWPHAVFFRALMAEYEATKNENIIAALHQHFMNDTIVYEGRDLINIETVAWLYQITKDPFYYDWCMKYESLFFKKGAGADDILYHFGSIDRQEIHAVTYYEFLKIPIIFYELTLDKKYLQIARNAFAKVDEYHMLPCGVASGEEGLSGKSSRNTHEMCDVVDYIWTCNYMLRATKEPRWADRIERALFNAGMGGITKNFDAHQYYSSPNQVVCSEHSSIVSTYDGSRLAYRQIHRPPCCTGNLNRMFPIYVGSQWMHDNEGGLYKMVYGSGEVTHRVGNREIRLCEDSTYPFGDTLRIRIMEGSADFSLHVRIPGWCSDPVVKMNGDVLSKTLSNSMVKIKRPFKKGDVVELVLPKQVAVKQWDFESLVVDYGPLLFALPVESQTQLVDVHTPKLQKDTYKGYSMVAISDWNYILGLRGDGHDQVKVIETAVSGGGNPWLQTPSPIRIRVPAYKDPAWTFDYKKIVDNSGNITFAPVTPALPPRGSMIFALNNVNPQAIELVPYGSTLLRISMFPFWIKGVIPPEVLATDTIK